MAEHDVTKTTFSENFSIDFSELLVADVKSRLGKVLKVSRRYLPPFFELSRKSGRGQYLPSPPPSGVRVNPRALNSEVGHIYYRTRTFLNHASLFGFLSNCSHSSLLNFETYCASSAKKKRKRRTLHPHYLWRPPVPRLLRSAATERIEHIFCTSHSAFDKTLLLSRHRCKLRIGRGKSVRRSVTAPALPLGITLTEIAVWTAV